MPAVTVVSRIDAKMQVRARHKPGGAGVTDQISAIHPLSFLDLDSLQSKMIILPDGPIRMTDAD